MWETKSKGIFRKKKKGKRDKVGLKKPDLSRGVGPPGGAARGGAARTGRGIVETTPHGQAL